MRSGYSLLEVLLAVALIALAGAMVAPSMMAGLERREARLAEAALQAGLTALRYEAVLSAAPLTIDPEDLPSRFDGLPDGWQVSADMPLRLSASGFCEEANVVLTGRGGRATAWHIGPPRCALGHARPHIPSP